MRRHYGWLLGALSIPLLCAPPAFGQTAAAQLQTPNYPAKEIAGFRTFFEQIGSLPDQVIQKDAHLNDQEVSLLRQVAQQCNAAYAAQTAAGTSAVNSLRQQYPPVAGAPPPAAVTQQLAALEAQRAAIINGCMQQLEAGMGAAQFGHLDLYVLVHIASKQKQGSFQPGAQGAGAAVPGGQPPAGRPLPAVPKPADPPYMSGPNQIRSLHPVSDAADVLRHSYLKVITYEDPLWEWPGEMRVSGPRVDPARKGGSTPDWVFLTLPAAPTPTLDLPARLAQVLDAYHQQTNGPRFQVLTSKLGLHIVPLQVRDRDGSLAPAQNPLDKLVFIPQQERTAHGHLAALQSSLVVANSALNATSVTGPSYSAGSDGFEIAIGPLVYDTRGDSFNFMFAPTRADDRPFVWGTAIPSMTARDALIDLLDRSATTFYWDMRCLGTLTVKYNVCTMHIAPLEITTVGPDGKPANPGGKIETLTNGRHMLEYDRCGGCEGGRALTQAEQSREKNKK